MKMIRKNTNKLRPETKSKILVLGLILIIVLVGLLSPMGKASAVDPVVVPAEDRTETTPVVIPAEDRTETTANQTAIAKAADSTSKSAFETEISNNECSINPASKGTFYPGCFIQLFYGLFYVIPSWFLYVSAYFFNVLISITLGTALFKLPFVGQAWGVVRDVSNIFFILILLYIAIKVILGLGGSEVKKMIAKVVIIALLINFSMFFTQVIIDTSNILALIFYNKVSVSTTDAQGNKTPYQNTGNGEKDVAGGLVNAFNPTKLLSQEYLDNAKTTKVETHWYKGNTTTNNVAPGILIGMTLIAGILMFFAAYCLVIVGLSFLGRLIELFILIIFSPFAFMSSTIPLFSSVEYLGWDAWFKRLLKVAFMAPIFMFFLYFIFLLVKADIFSGLKNPTTSMIESLLMIILPALLILVLLLKATKFAKEGSGAIGEMVMKGAKMAGGLALGAAGIAGGVAAAGGAKALRASVGHGAANLAESNKFREWAANTKGGQFISNRVSGLAGRSFDVRKAPGVGTLAKKAGINLDSVKAIGLGPKEGGFTKARADAVKKKEDFATKQLDTSEYGKAELTRGKMKAGRAAEIENQLIMGGMDRTVAQGHRANLEGNGINVADVAGVIRHLNATKREVYADRLDKRSEPTAFGQFFGRAQRINATKRMSANKIRRSAETAATNANIARVAAAFAAAGGVLPTPTTGGGAGGAGAGGGGAAGGAGGGTP